MIPAVSTIAAFAAAALLLPGAAGAQGKSPRQVACDVQAAQQGLKDAERQKFMDGCLGRQTAAAPPQKKAVAARENAMQRCNRQADAQGLDGPKRAAYLSRCLRGG